MIAKLDGDLDAAVEEIDAWIAEHYPEVIKPTVKHHDLLTEAEVKEELWKIYWMADRLSIDVVGKEEVRKEFERFYVCKPVNPIIEHFRVENARAEFTKNHIA